MCVSVYVKSPLRDPRLSRRVSVSLPPRVLVLRPAREDLETHVCKAYLHPRDRSRSRARDAKIAKRVSRSRSEKRSRIVMLSTSSRSRHSLYRYYIYSLSFKRDSHPSLLSALCVFLFFFSCVYLPLKVAGGCTACISLNDSVIFLFIRPHARRTCSRPSEIGRVASKNAFYALCGERTTRQSRFLSFALFAVILPGSISPYLETCTSNRYGNIYNGQRSMFALTKEFLAMSSPKSSKSWIYRSRSRPRDVRTIRQQFDAASQRHQLSLATRWSDAVHSEHLSRVSSFFLTTNILIPNILSLSSTYPS